MATASCSSSGDKAAVRIGAPADCVTNPYCSSGLARVYGIDVTKSLQQPNLANMAADLKAGSLDVAVGMSASPEARDPELVALVDDKGMLGAGNVAFAYREAAPALYGPQLTSDLDALATALTPDALASIDKALAEGQSPADAAQRWRATALPAPPAVAKKEGPDLVVGSVDFAENRALADVAVGYLADRGYPAKVNELPGGRNLAVDALANGDVTVVPEYVGPLLEFLNQGKGEATADVPGTVKRLAEYLHLLGAAVSAPAPAPSANTFLMTKAKADSVGLRTLSDLTKLNFPKVAAVGPPRGPSGPAQLGEGVRAAVAQIQIGSSGPEVRELQQRLVELKFPVNVTGTYDQPTLEAVRRFQASQGLPPDGVVGQATRDALASPKSATTSPQPVVPGDAGTKDPAGTAKDGTKLMYLTFDDGPSPEYTPQVLDLLDKFKAKATFFQVGTEVQRSPALTKSVAARGHALANHTFDHADLTKAEPTKVRNEIDQTTTAIQNAAGVKVTCLRPPYGALNASARSAIAKAGLTIELWDIDPQDWSRPGVDSIVSNVVQHAGPGKIVLMHDAGGNRSQTVQALSQVLEKLSQQGYRFERLPGC